ncbi:MAG: DUF4058 family protein [Fimbriiglobus sp.]
MPLLDHFHPPLWNAPGWSGVHTMWLGKIVDRLNSSVLSDRYRSEPEARLGTQIEADIAGYDTEPDAPIFGDGGGGTAVATATAVYAPPRPALTGEIDFTDPDLFEVRVYRNDGGWRLVAVVELVSPANKDRPEARRAFAGKCGSLLQSGVSVVTVDIVTSYSAELHAELATVLDLPAAFDWSSSTGLAAVSYRTVSVPAPRPAGTVRLDVWPCPLTIGQPLPTVPLWLAPGLAVPLDLEPTYQAMCRSLRLG